MSPLGAPSPPFLRWTLPLLSGLLPLLLLGLLYSALSDRLAFAGWALVSGGAYLLVLRRGLEAGWTPRRRAASVALVLSGVFAWLAALILAHHEALDLGFRAALPALYHPLSTAPSTALAIAAALALAGGLAWAVDAARRRSAA